MFSIKVNATNKRRVIRATEMKPGQIGFIIDDPTHGGQIVMRTSSDPNFCNERPEIMNLSDLGPGRCWTGSFAKFDVELLNPGESVTLTVEE